MKYIAFAVAACLLVALGVGLAPVLSQEAKPEPEDPSEAWMKLQQPGPEHKWLAEEVGEWEIDGKMWMEGMPDPIPMKGGSKITMLHERYLHEDFWLGEGDMGFKGFGYMGYDNSAKEYCAMFCGNSGTGMRVLRGQKDDKGVLTLAGKWHEKALGMDYAERVVSERKSKDEAVVTIYIKYGDAAEMKMLEMTYKRKK